MGMRFLGTGCYNACNATNRRMRWSTGRMLYCSTISGLIRGSHATLKQNPMCYGYIHKRARECGYWGSNNSMVCWLPEWRNSYRCNARDTDEIIMQKNPVACRGIGRTIIPGRLGVNGCWRSCSLWCVMVRPGDIIDVTGWCSGSAVRRRWNVLYFALKLSIDDKKSLRISMLNQGENQMKL